MITLYLASSVADSTFEEKPSAQQSLDQGSRDSHPISIAWRKLADELSSLKQKAA